MCIMSGHVKSVSSTRIFVGRVDKRIHATVYQMVVATDRPVAMILPVPVQEGSGEDAVEFVSLEGYPGFFDDMDALFGEDDGDDYYRSRGMPTKSAPLKVHSVGSFDASYVPGIGQFGRLDPMFRLPPQVWQQLPDYSRFGFAVFQLKPGRHQQVHPMAYRYSADRPDRLFFPTVHLHDGENVPRSAHFDHDLYVQPANPDRLGSSLHWDDTLDELPDGIDQRLSRGLVRPDRPIFRRTLQGFLRNTDTVAKDR